MRGAQFDHLTGADEENLLIGDTFEDPLTQAHRGSGHGDDIGPDRRRRPHFLGHREGVLKEFVQRRTKSARLLGNAYRLLHLAENLRLAENHRIEPTGNPKGMSNGIALGIGIEVRRDLMARQTMVVGEPLRRRVRDIARNVQLGTIAGRQDRRLVDRFAVGQVRQSPRQAFGMKRHLLANREWCCVVVDTKGEQRHAWGTVGNRSGKSAGDYSTAAGRLPEGGIVPNRAEPCASSLLRQSPDQACR
jgi:hypothetical protein